MLTVREPVFAALQGYAGKLRDDFARCIITKYQSISGTPKPEDMIHVLPDFSVVYLEQGAQTSSVFIHSRFLHQETNVRIVHNVQNRISAADTGRLNARDRALLRNILHWPVIGEWKEFFHRFREIRREKKNPNLMRTLYPPEQVMSVRIKRYGGERQEAGAARSERQTYQQGTVRQFCHKITRRLRTQNICRQIWRFLSNRRGSQTDLYTHTVRTGRHMTVCSRMMHRSSTAVFQGRQWDISGSVHVYQYFPGGNGQNEQAGMVSRAAERIYGRFAEWPGSLCMVKKDIKKFPYTIRRYEGNTVQMPGQTFYRQGITVERLNIWRRYTEGRMLHRIFSRMREKEQAADRYDADRILNVTENSRLWERDIRHTEQSRETDMKRQLDRINRSNVKAMEKLRQIRASVQGTERKRIDRDKAREDGLEAILHPRETILRYMASGAKCSGRERMGQNGLGQILSRETMAILEMTERYRTEPAVRGVQLIAGEEAGLRLLRDIEQKENEKRERFIREENGSETIVQTAGAVYEAAGKNIRAQIGSQRRNQQEDMRSLHLLHRRSETNQELLEELRRGSRNIAREITDQRETVNRIDLRQETVVNHVNELRLHSNEELDRTISRNVRQQISSLTEQVYGKIEKRLEAEKRRRGL